MPNRKEEAKQKGKENINGVVSEQHYLSLLARGSAFHPLTLPCLAGLLESSSWQTQLWNISRLHRLLSSLWWVSQQKEERPSGTDTQGHKQSIKISSPFIFVALFVIPAQVVHTFLVSEEVTEQNMLCRSRRPLFRNQMQQMRSSLSLPLSLQRRDYLGCWHCITCSSKTAFQQGNYSCPPSRSPCRSECHEFHNFSSGHDNGGGGLEIWNRRK